MNFVTTQHQRKYTRTLLLGLGIVVAIVVVYMLGFWLELLWYSATDSADRFWQFGPSRIAFALIGALFAASLAWPPLALTSMQPMTTTTLVTLFSLAAVSGAIWGLGIWELLSMLAHNCRGVGLLELVNLCSRWNGSP